MINSPRSAETQQIAHRAGSVESNLEELALKTSEWFVYVTEMQKILQKEKLTQDLDLLDVNERLLKLKCSIVLSILKDIEKSTEIEKIIAHGILSSVCEFALSSPVKLPTSLHELPVQIDGRTVVKPSHLWQAQVMNSGFILSELVSATNLQYLMIKLNNFYVPTRSKLFAEINGCSEKFSQNGEADLLDALLSFHPEIAHIKRIRPDITEENFSLKHRLATLWNDESTLAEYIAVLIYRNGQKSELPIFDSYHFKDLEAYTAWATESLLLRLMVIEQDLARVIDTLETHGKEPFKLLEKLTTKVNLGELANQFAQCEKWRELSEFKELVDGLPKVKPLEKALKDNLDIKLLQLELRNAILSTGVVIRSHPKGCVGELTPILGVLTDFMQACVRLEHYINNIISLLSKAEFLEIYKKVAEDAKYLNPVSSDPIAEGRKSRSVSSAGQSQSPRAGSVKNSPRGPTSAKNSPRGVGSAKNSPRNQLSASAEASTVPTTIPSTEPSPRESLLAPPLPPLELTAKPERVLQPRMRESPNADRRKQDGSIRSRTLLKSLNRKSSGGLQPLNEGQVQQRRSEETRSPDPPLEDAFTLSPITSKSRLAVQKVFAQPTVQAKSQPPAFIRRKSEPYLDTEVLGSKLNLLAAERAHTHSAEPDVRDASSGSSDNNPKL